MFVRKQKCIIPKDIFTIALYFFLSFQQLQWKHHNRKHKTIKRESMHFEQAVETQSRQLILKFKMFRVPDWKQFTWPCRHIDEDTFKDNVSITKGNRPFLCFRLGRSLTHIGRFNGRNMLVWQMRCNSTTPRLCVGGRRMLMVRRT